ncbi:hypothetical protein PHLGIDRAFT_90639 [Phlebiopsis gigantea 11061_1 CR5-6]|uniref:Membrane insertase YidC/Oxa/ALB C-terminal domain-containing protein n=1 Tax=Phlebiopsis gigantea (strain 11061_1 CR5-6) TaxID=745531 RepID=A0A0C3PK77_PHLG1|nr:hypothetical protein PHLGIDRAFT_90639 [Phlebiopsis gigantea 11061_1 CR5-6]
MAPHQAEFEKLRDEISRAARTKEQGAMQRAVLKQQSLYKKIGVSVPGMLVPPFAQIPVTLGMFFGVKRLCELPVPQLKDSGVAYFSDLTVADPTYVLPIVATAGMNWMLSLGMRDMSASAHVPHIINLFRGLSFFGFFFMVNLPAGTVVYLTTGIVCMAVQSLVLRIPAVRLSLGLPLRPAGEGLKPASMMDSIQYAKQYWEDQKKHAMEKARADAARRR